MKVFTDNEHPSIKIIIVIIIHALQRHTPVKILNISVYRQGEKENYLYSYNL